MMELKWTTEICDSVNQKGNSSGDRWMKIEKLWGGRFEELPPKEIVDFLSGRDVKGIPPCDERLIPYDLWGNRAHLLMLCRQGDCLQTGWKENS